MAEETQSTPDTTEVVDTEVADTVVKTATPEPDYSVPKVKSPSNDYTVRTFGSGGMR